ncbi:MAG TPA: ABC transporter ATP-binding protein, partial [Chryseolinea sp.]|nr:ABC transporter ATP-binding protein [Chryseolinea sp.]
SAEAEYKRIYYIPELESNLEYCLNQREDWRNTRAEKMSQSLSLLRSEISNELKFVGADNFKEIEELAIGKFDSTVYMKANHFLTVLKAYYGMRLERAMHSKDSIIAVLSATPEMAKVYEQQKKRLVNQAVSDAVKNINTTERIVEYDGQLIQKIYPVYADDHKPKSILDFRANLFQPTKYFGGTTFDTVYFNLAVIWSMTGVFFVTLYTDALKKFLSMLERQRKQRKRRRNEN